MNTRNQIDTLTIALNTAGLTARAWKNKRIYLNGFGRDISAYITLDEPESEAVADRLFNGCSLKIYSSCESQPHQWRVNRAKQIKHGVMQTLYNEGTGITGHLGAVCKTWQEVIL